MIVKWTLVEHSSQITEICDDNANQIRAKQGSTVSIELGWIELEEFCIEMWRADLSFDSLLPNIDHASVLLRLITVSLCLPNRNIQPQTVYQHKLLWKQDCAKITPNACMTVPMLLSYQALNQIECLSSATKLSVMKCMADFDPGVYDWCKT